MRMPEMREFFAPVPLAAVALMGLNDAWFKTQFHNALTGKLSDLAGCFFLPLFVSALLSFVPGLAPRTRLLIGAGSTALLFIGIKVSQPAADRLCMAMNTVGKGLGTGCSRILADPTDLIAVPFIFIAVVYGMWRAGAAPDHTTESQGVPT